MKKLYYTLFILSSLIIGTAAIQSSTTCTVHGTVQDANGNPLGQVTVLDKGIDAGTATTSSGNYTYVRAGMTANQVIVTTFEYSKTDYSTYSKVVGLNTGSEMTIKPVVLIIQK